MTYMLIFIWSNKMTSVVVWLISVGCWGSFVPRSSLMIRIHLKEGFKKKLVEYSTKGLTPPPLVEKIFIS